jgi:hypothetical protein
VKGPRRSFLPAALVLLATLAPNAPANSAGSPDSVALTDERTVAHWAHPQERTAIRRGPSHTSPQLARTRYLTEDGYPEVYPVLRRLTDPSGRTWLKVRIPMRPNGRIGWVPQQALGPLHRVRTRLVVDRRRLTATLLRSGRRIWRSRIGIGAPGTPTPAGRFWIREKFRVANAGGLYGPRAFGTGAYSRLSDWPGGGVIGIHGTSQPQLIPGRPSHGCIRIRNAAITRLYELLPIGTPLEILR